MANKTYHHHKHIVSCRIVKEWEGRGEKTGYSFYTKSWSDSFCVGGCLLKVLGGYNNNIVNGIRGGDKEEEMRVYIQFMNGT